MADILYQRELNRLKEAKKDLSAAIKSKADKATIDDLKNEVAMRQAKIDNWGK